MKYLLTQILILILSVIFLFYLISLDYFLPLEISGGLNWYNVGIVLFLAFLSLQSFISLVVYLFQKFLAYGWKEFPDFRSSLKWGLGLALSIIAILLLNIFHILMFQWALLVLVLVVIALIVI